MPAPFTDDPLVPGVPPVQADHFTELHQRMDALRRVAGLQAFPGTTVRGPVLPVGAVRSPRLRATRPRGKRLAGPRPAGPAQASRRGARRTVRRHHDPRTDDTRRRASGDHQSGIPSSRWPKARLPILLQLRPRCLTPVIGRPRRRRRGVRSARSVVAFRRSGRASQRTTWPIA